MSAILDAKHSPDATCANPPGDAPPGLEMLRPVEIGRAIETWKVCAKLTGEPFLLKRIRSRFADAADVRLQIQREREAAGAVAGRFVRPLNDRIGGFALLMEWEEGETLARRLDRCERLPLGTAFWIARQIVQGLQELQQAGFSHGDVRPENVLLLADGRVKLTNLAFSLPLKSSGEHINRVVDQRSAEYLAPEFGCDPAAHPRAADVYGLGVLLFRMLGGRAPFTGEVAADVLRLHRQAKPPAVESHCPAIPAAGAELIAALLRKQPMRRPQNLVELLRELISLELQTLTLRRPA